MKTVKTSPKDGRNIGAITSLPPAAAYPTTRSSPGQVELSSDDNQTTTSIARKGPMTALISSDEDSDPVLIRSVRPRRNTDASSEVKKCMDPNAGMTRISIHFEQLRFLYSEAGR